MAAVGWETETNEDIAAPADIPTEPAADHVLPESVDEGDVDEVPQPVTVGPVLEVSSESPEIAPVYPEVEAAAAVVDPEDVEMLQDLVVAAVAAAMGAAASETEKSLGGLADMGGLGGLLG